MCAAPPKDPISAWTMSVVIPYSAMRELESWVVASAEESLV